jgi:hypothetical protein
MLLLLLRVLTGRRSVTPMAAPKLSVNFTISNT